MSLIHWWPLNGNLKDYGLKPIDLTMNNIPSTQYINGKIGQCYNFNGGAWAIASGVSVGKDCSICAWAKTSYVGAMLWGMQCTGSDYMNLYNAGPICLNVGDSGDNPFHDGDTPVYAINDDIWHHFVVVFKGDELAKIYLDGVYRGTATIYRNPTMDNQNFTIGTWNYSEHGYYWNGGINDVRIYDHALSTKEVKEISKGLILHYNFEDPYVEGTTNLITQAITDGGWYWSGSATVTNETVNVDNPALPFRQCRKTTYNISESVGGTYDTLQSHVQVSGSTMYAYSVYVKTNLPFSPNILYRYEYDSNNGYITESGIASESNREDLGGGWYRYYGTFTTQSNTANITFQTFNYPSQTGELYRYVGGAQVERKDHATPYVNGTRQPGTIYDNSGYGYNGTIVGDCQIIPESKSGDYSLFNNGSGLDNWNETGKAFVLGDLKNAMAFEKMTISFWAKIMATYGNHSGVISLSMSDYWPTDYTTGGLAQYDGTFRFNTSGGSPSVAQNIVFNEWHHYAFTWDGSTLSMYRDGVWVAGTSSSGSINQSRYVFLGLNGAGGMWRKSQIDWGDFKLFATALSALDILAEYNRKASIDRNGNLFAPYIKEHETTNNLLFNTNVSSATSGDIGGWWSSIKQVDYSPNPNALGCYAYTQANLSVTSTSNGFRIYSKPNWDGRSQEGSGWDTWGGLILVPMQISNCLHTGHRYRISWHMSGQSSRGMDIYWSNNVGWGQYPDASPTVHKTIWPGTNFQGEMDCFYDFTIEDGIFKTTGSDVHSGFEPNTSYLAYCGFKIGYTYDFTGELGTDVYITNIQMHDLTNGEVYKIEKNGIVKTTEAISGRRDSARLHSDGVIDVTDIEEC